MNRRKLKINYYSNCYSICLCSLLSALFYCGPSSNSLWAQTAASDYQVDRVVVEGGNRIDLAAIFQLLKAKPGAVSTSVVSEDVKALYGSGFFDTVNASVETKEGKHLLKYVVTEKPVVRKIYIKGNKEISEKDLSEILKLESKRFLDKSKIQALVKNAVALYQGRGYYDASFEYSVVPVGDNQVDLTFTVVEGKIYRITKIEFNGLKEVDEDDLRSTIQTKRYKWYSSWLFGTGRLNKDMLENDRALMKQYFLNHGYIDASVSDALVEKKDGYISISFEVVEGVQYKIGEVSANGDLIDQDQVKTLDGITTKPGEVFSAEEVRNDSFKISDKFSDRGFAFANVVPNTSLDRSAGTVNLQYSINKGNLVSINRINVKGNTKTYDHVIRRELKVAEQDTYNGSKVKRSEALLRRLGYFEEVNIANEPNPADPKQVDLNVNVREGSTGSFSIGAGFSSSDGAIFNSRLSEDNILGTGRRANINLDYGSQRDNLTLALEDRRVGDSFWSLGGDAMRTDREYSDFDRRLTGGDISAGYPLEEIFGESFEDFGFSVNYQYLGIDIRRVDAANAAQLVIASAGKSTASGITPKLTRNTIDNPLNPSKGSRQTLSFEATGLGGDERYYVAEFRQQGYASILSTGWGDIIGSWRFSFGYGKTYDGDPFPLFRRYFPGGINSIRGFKSRTLGPKDVNGHEYGGSKEVVDNLELIFPISNSAGLKGVVFYDFGQAFDDSQSIKFADFRQAYGFGIRWGSPLGPIRIEFGLPVSPEPGERHFVTMFSFGAPL